MAVFVALGAFLMTPVGGWVARRVTDRRHLVLGFGPTGNWGVGIPDRRGHTAALSTNRRATPGAEAQCVCR